MIEELGALHLDVDHAALLRGQGHWVRPVLRRHGNFPFVTADRGSFPTAVFSLLELPPLDGRSPRLRDLAEVEQAQVAAPSVTVPALGVPAPSPLPSCEI